MKKVLITMEEWQRLAAIPPEEKDKAFRKLMRWVTWQIIHRGFNLDHGPFSYANLGGDAVDVISNECMEALFCGEWHWNKDRSLSSQLIQIAKSKMGHIIEDYYENDKPEHVLTGDDDFCEQFERTVADQLQREANLRDMGYEIARKAVSNYPKLLEYLDALYKTNDYAAIAKEMNLSKPKVMELEKQLLELLENM